MSTGCTLFCVLTTPTEHSIKNRVDAKGKEKLHYALRSLAHFLNPMHADAEHVIAIHKNSEGLIFVRMRMNGSERMSS